MDLLKKPGPHPTCSNDEIKKAPKTVAPSEWPPKAVAILLDMYVEKFFAGRGCLRSKDWEEVMHKVNAECEGLNTVKNAKQCRDKVDSLKRRYKAEKRKAVNGDEVTWPFFDKLDNMMGSALRQARGFEPVDRLPKSSMYSGHEINEVDDEEHDKQGSLEERGGFEIRRRDMDIPFYTNLLENGKAKVEERLVTSEEGFDANLYQGPSKRLRPAREQISPDVSSGQETHPSPPWQHRASSKRRARNRETESDGSAHAFADALAGFADVYARVEMAKIEIMTKMKLEFAKLGRKRRRRRHRKSSSRTSFTNPPSR